MKDKLLYITQKKWIAAHPNEVTEEILKIHNKLYDKLLMGKIIENEELDDKPFYNLKKQEVITDEKK